MGRLTFHRDVVSGGVLLALSALYYHASRVLPAGRDEPGPAFFPVLLAGALAVLAVALVLRGWRNAPDDAETPPDGRRVAGAIGLTGLYVALFGTLGFLVSTALFTLAVTFMFNRGRSARVLAWPVLATLAIYLLFDVALGARLPVGIFR